ncbi:MAG: hypothetical protein C4291_02610 [Candidatus Dadabacteria bacterium]
MKCPNCGFNSFDYLSTCKRCGNPLKPNPIYKAIYESVSEAEKKESAKIDERALEKPVSGAVLSAPDLSRAQTPSGTLNEPQIRSISDENKMEEDESLNLSIPSEFLPYRSSSGQSRQEEWDDTESPVPSIYSAYNSVPEDLQSKEKTISFNLAGIGSRIAAFIIDLIIIFGIATLTLGIGLLFAGTSFSLGWGEGVDVLIPVYIILLFLGSTYFVFLEGITGKTIGKMILGIRIIRDDGESMRLWEAFVRWLGYYVSAFFIFIGFIWAVFDSKSQAWHDKFAGTYVVKE